jgi:hypothetical protein
MTQKQMPNGKIRGLGIRAPNWNCEAGMADELVDGPKIKTKAHHCVLCLT